MKRLSLKTEFDELYKGSDLQKIINNNPLPIKYTVDGFDCFFYNADLFGLFEMKITKEGITPHDFINDYKNGFIEGLEYLKKEAKIKIKDLKNANLRDGTIKQMQNILFEREFEFGSKGLINLVFNKIPSSFTEKGIFDFGKWNGIIHSIENLCEITGLNENDLRMLTLQQPEAVIPDTIKKEFKDFFNSDVEAKIIESIQTDFKDFKGRPMAILIYLLENEFKLVSYSLDSKTAGRKHLVDSLNNSKPNMQPINICFVTHTYKLDIKNLENDKDYINIKEKLLKTIN